MPISTADLAHLTAPQLASFAIGCAGMLVPVLIQSARVHNRADQIAPLLRALEAHNQSGGEGTAASSASWKHSFRPEEDAWYTDDPLAENGVSAVLYALAPPSPDNAMWSARQVEEAGDTIVQSLALDRYLDAGEDGGTSAYVGAQFVALRTAVVANNWISLVKYRRVRGDTCMSWRPRRRLLA